MRTELASCLYLKSDVFARLSAIERSHESLI